MESNFNIIQVYALTTESEEDNIEKVYEELRACLRKQAASYTPNNI